MGRTDEWIAISGYRWPYRINRKGCVQKQLEDGSWYTLKPYIGGGRSRAMVKMRSKDNRACRFVCAIACILPDGQEMTVRGECQGELLRESRGAGGFGYDPLFFVPEYGCTFGELPGEVKNRISHRGRALRALKDALKTRI